MDCCELDGSRKYRWPLLCCVVVALAGFRRQGVPLFLYRMEWERSPHRKDRERAKERKREVVRNPRNDPSNWESFMDRFSDRQSSLPPMRGRTRTRVAVGGAGEGRGRRGMAGSPSNKLDSVISRSMVIYFLFAISLLHVFLIAFRLIDFLVGTLETGASRSNRREQRQQRGHLRYLC